MSVRLGHRYPRTVKERSVVAVFPVFTRLCPRRQPATTLVGMVSRLQVLDVRELHVVNAEQHS